MSVIGHSPLAGASGAAGGSADPLYVDDVFSTTLYTSNASSTGDGTEQVVTTGIDHTEGFLTWIKNRDDAVDHVLFDSERTSPTYKWLYSNSTNPEQDTADIFKSPTSTGFTVRMDTSGSGVGRTNPSGSKDFVSWTFRKAPKFFDVVTYSGTGSAQNISHSLGSVPGMIMIHCRDGTHDWEVYHRSTGATKSLHLNNTDGQATDSTVWNNTTPTSSVFTVGTSSNVNQNGHGYVAYVFAHDEQSFGTDSDEAIIKCGSFTSPSSGSFTVDLGFEPQWLMVKRTSSDGGSWVIRDVMRGWKVNGFERLFAESDQAEDSSWIDSTYFPITSTGFSTTTDWVGSNATSIYMAIRRPHKPPTAATEVFNPINDVGSSSARKITAGNLVDLVMSKSKTNGAYGWYWLDRLRGARQIISNSTAAESANVVSSTTFDEMNGIYVAATDGWTSASPWGGPYAKYFFTRTPGFFDVVAYTGTGSLSGVNHNLGVTPQLKIIKSRSDSYAWIVGGSAVLGENGYTYLNTNGGVSDFTNYWDGGDDSATHFSVRNGNNFSDSAGKTYVAYLFATLDGISKVGTYTGTGSNINVDCGFTAGARFVVIKRADIGDAGNWYVWDSVSGIVSGNDPYLRFNASNSQTTNTDYIDPLNAGFTVTSSAPADLNANGGNYLFLAIA